MRKISYPELLSMVQAAHEVVIKSEGLEGRKIPGINSTQVKALVLVLAELLEVENNE